MRRGKMVNYTTAEIGRNLAGGKFLIGILGVALTLLLAIGKTESAPSVLDGLLRATYKTEFAVTFVFCAFVGATAFSEDLEYRYVRYMVIRGGAVRYVFQKLIVCFFSALAVMAAGMMVFSVAYRLRFPILSEYTIDSVMQCSYPAVYQGGYYWIWILLFAVQWGIWAGCLSVAAAVLALFVTNRMLVLAFPVFLDQIISELATRQWELPAFLYPRVVFDARMRLFDSTPKALVWIWGTGAVWIAASAVISLLRLKKRM